MATSKSILILIAILAYTAPTGAQESSAAEETKFQVFASGLYNTQTFSFTDDRSYPIYLEESRFTGNWTSATGPAFSFGATYAVIPGLSLGAGFDFLSATPTENFVASIPHPLFFNDTRSLEGEAPSLSYNEKVVNFLASYTRNVGRIIVAVSGGPSYFWTTTELIDSFTYSEAYPFDEVVLESVEIGSYDASSFGFNVGGWFGYRVLEQLAVGGDLRFNRATVKFTTTDGNEIELDAGGFRVGAGIRLLF